MTEYYIILDTGSACSLPPFFAFCFYF